MSLLNSKATTKKIRDITAAAELLASKIWTLEKVESIYMWDEVIVYLEGRRNDANRNPEGKGLGR